MGSCCGPFKRGKPAKAINPNQQCFADCCGNLCPPDGCCQIVKIHYECGCNCTCSHQGYNFSGLRFKKKNKKSKIPSFSRKTLAANGFTFANGGTIPTGSSSSSESSSSSSSCPCEPFVVEITTDGCCLYLGPSTIEAVGPGTITAIASGTPPTGCEPKVLMNGVPINAIVLSDGDTVDIQISTGGTCDCCEVQKECLTPSTNMWVQKSNKENKTLVLDREAIRSKVRLAVERVRGKNKRG